MEYNFDEIVPRRGTGSYKWDSDKDEDIIPMWVADMDFRTAPAVTEALKKRVEHGVFGYTKIPDAYYDALSGWFSGRHGLDILKDWVICVPGVVPALSAIIKALASPGDKVLIQTPVYNCFFSSIRNNGCIAEECPLKYEDHTYHIDFAEFEKAASDPSVKLFLLCNPHNPAGRVWTREELLEMGRICMRHGVMVVADEIHCELVFPGHRYIPFASLSEEFRQNSVTCVSPSKAFNIAGLQIANIVCPDPEVRSRVDRAVNVNEVCDVNPFGVEGLIAAYTHGGGWLDGLLDYLYGNYRFLEKYFAENLPWAGITRLEGTYLVWADISASGRSSSQIAGELLENGRVRVNDGTMYGTAGEGFIRINIACPRAVLKEGLERICRTLAHYGKD